MSSNRSTATSSSQSSAAAALVAARAAQVFYFGSTTPAPSSSKKPPLFEVSHTTLNSSPAESTLTPAHTQGLVQNFVHDERGELFPAGVVEEFESSSLINDHDAAVETAINAELEELIYDVDHKNDQQVSDDFMIGNPDKEDDSLLLLEDAEDEAGRDQAAGGDSDDEGDEADIHNIALARRIIDDDDCEECFTKSAAERIVLSASTMGTVFGLVDEEDAEIDDEIGEPSSGIDKEINLGACGLIGAPEGWLPPSVPITFPGYRPKQEEPPESEIDNPGGWSMFTFTPSYHPRSRVYDGHTTPTGAHVVPPAADGSGRRIMAGWEFHYKNWKAEPFDISTYARSTAKFGNLKPESRKGSLDASILRKHGLNSERMRHDPLFFYQLLFPFCSPSDSGVANDARMPFYSNVSVCTNMYAMWKGAGSGYGHDFTPVSIPELVHWAGVPLRNGALDGKPHTMYHRWKEHDPRYDPTIAENITLQRWRQIKRYFKLSMGIEEKKRGEPGYDPCAKYDYIYRCLVHNMNYVTERADLDATIDETTWGFMGYCGPAGWRLTNKPKSKGEVVMLMSVMLRFWCCFT